VYFESDKESGDNVPRSSNQKLKLLYLVRILLEQTDEDNPFTAQGIIDALAVYGVSANRKSIYDDIEVLRQWGIDIVNRRGKGGGYFVGVRDFEIAELKMLVDAVQSSRFITDKKSSELIDKLSQLTSKSQAKQLKRQVYVNGRAKALNEALYYNIDAIHAAINGHKKISFKYFSYTVEKKRKYRFDGDTYIRNPVALCWNDDRYYLIACSIFYEDSFATFRVDRMTDVKVLEEDADMFDSKAFSVAEFVKRTFGMFGGEIVKAKLAFHESLISVVMDQFGSDVRLEEMPDGWFSVSAEVAASPVFLGWIFQLGNKAAILSPDSLKKAMRDLVAEVGQIYEL